MFPAAEDDRTTLTTAMRPTMTVVNTPCSPALLPTIWISSWCEQGYESAVPEYHHHRPFVQTYRHSNRS